MNTNKNQVLLSYFWDLSSEDTLKRQESASNIINYLIEKQAESSEVEKQCDDVLYSLKRLIRGISSSREAARQGFAVCLTELLNIPSVTLAESLTLLEENTKVTASMKGSEERDMIFGKIFGYISIIRSNQLLKASNLPFIEDIVSRLLSLYSMKSWLKEIIVETLILLLDMLLFASEGITLSVPEQPNSSVLDELTATFILNLKPLMPVTLSDLSSSQLLLCLGLEHTLKRLTDSKSSKDNILRNLRRILPDTESVLTTENFKLITPALMSSAAGYPQIHRLWDYILGAIFGLDSDRNLLSTRATHNLSASSESILSTLLKFIETELVLYSNEKRGLAMYLTTELLRLSPTASVVGDVTTKSIVRCIVKSRRTKKNLLYSLGGHTLNRMIASVGDESSFRVTLASKLVQYGGGNFDAIVGIPAVEKLLQDVDESSIEAHVRLLCSMIGSSSQIEVDEDENDKDIVMDINQTRLSNTLSSIEALTCLSKNPNIPHRQFICSATISLLITLSCVPLDSINSTSLPTTKSKSKKESLNKEDQWPRDRIVSAIKTVDFSWVNISDESDSATKSMVAKIESKIAEESARRLKSLLLDLSSPSLSSDSNQSRNGMESNSLDQHSYINIALEYLNFMISSWKLPLLSTDDSEELETIQRVLTTLQVSKKPKSGTTTMSKEKNNERGIVHLNTALEGLLAHSLFHVLTSKELNVQILSTLLDISNELLETNITNTKEKAKADDSDDDDEIEEPLVQLLDICLELLSVSADQAIRGIRDSIKRVWTALSHSQSGKSSLITPALLQSVLDAVVGEQGSDDGESQGDDNDNEENNDGSDEDDDEENNDGSDDDDKEEKNKHDIKKDSKKPRKEKVPSDSESKLENHSFNNEDDEEEEFIDEDQMIDILQEEITLPFKKNDEDDDSDVPEMAEHSEEADAALGAMLQLRGQSRLRAVLQAKRTQMLIQSRAIDILEILYPKIEIPSSSEGAASLAATVLQISGELLLTYKKLASSKMHSRLQEGKAFLTRLQLVIEEKIVKKKFSFQSLLSSTVEPLPSDLQEQLEEILEETLSTVSSCMCSHISEVRSISFEVFLYLLKLFASYAGSLSSQLQTHASSLYLSYMTKKAGKFSIGGGKFFEDLCVKHTDLATLNILSSIVSSIAQGKTSYLRTEATRHLTEILKRFKGIAALGQQRILELLPDILSSTKAYLETCLSSISNNESSDSTNKGTSMKRLKSVFGGIKELLVAIKGVAIVGNAIVQDKKVSIPSNIFVSVGDDLDYVAILISKYTESDSSAGVSRLAVQLVELIDGLKSSKLFLHNVSENSSKKSNGSKKRKNDDGAVDYEEQYVASVIDQETKSSVDKKAIKKSKK